MTAQNFKRHLQPISFAWRPLAFLPVTPSRWVQLNDLPKVVPPVDNGAKFEHRVSCPSFILSPLYHAIPLDFIDFLHKWWVIFKDITRGCYINNTACVLSHSVMSDCLRAHGLQHAWPPCPSPTPRVYSNSCPLSWWCHPTISFSIVPLSLS